MRYKNFINETALQTGELRYITSRLYNKRDYFNANQTPDQICRTLEDIFKEEIIFEWRDKIEESSDKAAINAGIAAARYAGGFVQFDLNPNFYKSIKTEAAWKKFINILSDYFHHEMVHALQDQRMSDDQRSKEAKSYFKILQSGKDEDYLKYPAELMAFALTSVREFKRAKFDSKQILNILKNPNSKEANKSPIFCDYRKYFMDKDRKTWNKFLRYCSEYAAKI